MVHFIERYPPQRQLGKQAFAKRMKRRQRHVFRALPDGLHHARLHLPRGLARERQPQYVFAGKIRMRDEQVADSFRDDARLPRPGARDHQQWPFAVLDRPPLRLIQLRIRLGGTSRLKKSCHVFCSLADFRANRKQTTGHPQMESRIACFEVPLCDETARSIAFNVPTFRVL